MSQYHLVQDEEKASTERIEWVDRSKHYVEILKQSRKFLSFSVLFIFLISIFIIELSASHRATNATQSIPKSSLIDRPFDPLPMQQVCNRTQWDPNLVIQCQDVYGGIGNVRNQILTCVRFTMEAGGAMVMPNIATRNKDDLASLHNDAVSFAHFFDVEHFRQSMEAGCPQMQIYDSIHVVPLFHSRSSIPLSPTKFFNGIVNKRINERPEAWRPGFRKWLAENQKNNEIISMEASMFVYPMYYDGFPFASNFGGVLRFRQDVRELASKVLTNLSRTFNIDLGDRTGIQANKFLGIHLRVEQDLANEFSWMRYDTQASGYLELAKESGIKVVYVASGDVNEVAKFSATARELLNVTVVQKQQLLSDPDLQQLRNMTWDQQGTVDFMVLLSSSVFGGIVQSSFSWNVALKRQMSMLNWAEAGVYDISQPLKGPTSFKDQANTILGDPYKESYFPMSLWV